MPTRPAVDRQTNRASTSGYSFKPLTPPSTFKFSQQLNEPFSIRSQALQKNKPKHVPDLVPIARSVQPNAFNGFSNGFASSTIAQPRGRRSVFDFSKKNRVRSESSFRPIKILNKLPFRPSTTRASKFPTPSSIATTT